MSLFTARPKPIIAVVGLSNRPNRASHEVAAYMQANEKVIKLGRDKLQVDAADIADGLASMAFDEVVSALNALIQFNYDGGEASATLVTSVYDRARFAVMGLIGEKFRGVDPASTVTCPPLGSTVYKVELEVTAYRNASKAQVEVIRLSQ